jgi:hypothetical protein
MSELSPAAQAVLNAAKSAYWAFDQICPADAGVIAAAVVLALADQVAPSDAIEPRNNLPMAIENDRHRREMLAIAAELEAVPVHPPDTDVPRIAARLKELSRYVTEGPECVAREFTMRIPAQPYRDADLVLDTAARLLATWPASTPAPVPVVERLPDAEDCAPWPDELPGQHWCWFGQLTKDDADLYFQWVQCWPNYGLSYKYTHWLPYWALPLPEATK